MIYLHPISVPNSRYSISYLVSAIILQRDPLSHHYLYSSALHHATGISTISALVLAAPKTFSSVCHGNQTKETRFQLTLSDRSRLGMKIIRWEQKMHLKVDRSEA